MRTRISGVREIIKGERYEVNYVISGKRYQYRIDASSLTEAFSKKLQDMAEKKKNASMLMNNGERKGA